MTRLYLAYGSNLHKQQMRGRCPDAVPLRTIWLSDHRLVFRGVADIAPSPGDQVPCGLWRISARDERALDLYEGVAGGLYSKCRVRLEDGKLALIYKMNSTGIAPPSEYYLNVIRRGYNDFGLPTRYLDRAVWDSWDDKNHDEQTRSRRARRRASSQRVARKPSYKNPETAF